MVGWRVMDRKRLFAIVQMVLILGAVTGALAYNLGNFWTAARKVGEGLLFVAGILLILKLLSHFKLIDEKKLVQGMDHSKKVQKQPRAKIGLGVGLIGFLVPMALGGYLFSDPVQGDPWVRSFNNELIQRHAIALGASATIASGFGLVLIFKWVKHWAGRAAFALIGLILLAIYWESYFSGEAAYLLFAGWALSTCWIFPAVGITYVLHLERITPVSVETEKS